MCRATYVPLWLWHIVKALECLGSWFLLHRLLMWMVCRVIWMVFLNVWVDDDGMTYYVSEDDCVSSSLGHWGLEGWISHFSLAFMCPPQSPFCTSLQKNAPRVIYYLKIFRVPFVEIISTKPLHEQLTLTSLANWLTQWWVNRTVWPIVIIKTLVQTTLILFSHLDISTAPLVLLFDSSWCSQ